MPTDVETYRYQRNLTVYHSSDQYKPYTPYQYYQGTKNIRDFLNKYGKQPSGFLNNLPIFECLGYQESITARNSDALKYKIAENYMEREEIDISKKKKKKNHGTTDLEDVTKNSYGFDISQLIDFHHHHYVNDEFSIYQAIANYPREKNLEDTSEFDGLLTPEIYHPSTYFSISKPHDILTYMNNFYEIRIVRIGENFCIESFNVELTAHGWIIVTSVYTYMGVTYKTILKEHHSKTTFSIKSYVEYNNLIEIFANFILDQMIQVAYVKFDGHGDFYCPVCMNDDSESSINPVRILKCRHTLCQGCLKEWSHIKSQCPYCNATFSNFKKFPRYLTHQQIFMSKYWKLKVLLNDTPMFQLLQEFGKLQTGLVEPSLNVNMISLMTILTSKAKMLAMTQDFDKREIDFNKCIEIDNSLKFENSKQSLSDDLIGYLSVIANNPERRKTNFPKIMGFQSLIFLGDYLFKDCIKKFQFQKIGKFESRQIDNIQSNSNYDDDDDDNESASLLRHVVPKKSSNSGGPMSLLRNLFQESVSDLENKIKYPFTYDTYFRNYDKTVMRLYDDWIDTTILDAHQVFIRPRIGISLAVMFQKNPNLFQKLLHQQISEYNFLANLVKKKHQRKMGKPNDSLIPNIKQTIEAKKYTSAPVTENELLWMEIVVTLSDLFEMSIIFYKEFKIMAKQFVYHKKIGEKIQGTIEMVLDSQIVNDFIYMLLSPSVAPQLRSFTRGPMTKLTILLAFEIVILSMLRGYKF
ncbi:hypothetical protein DASC09_056820 [Saccharomycopsis crataegensis]|uniref:RING-type domain-containing protein n=1 Tax=Saccharomycopsis crataegensis TaxID=43959 RepID=A0AAV5QTV4_9ASCO|nr:hypothetical protein DASC09_056820 [Saccharomycopsis crataegensis]